jgi:hypothetical protein
MAIKSFKEIIENKGYRINPQDRNIFEESDIQSFFGISENDYIEFVMYDINDNQLNQKNYGGVRYIPLTGQNIGDYFLLTEGTLFQKYKFPSEYFIDVNRLIKEAGYNSGIFKTQVTLINKRLGSDREFDKVWIQEISPSRTEIRVLVHKKGKDIFPELAQQYNAFVNDLEFRDDTIRNTFEYIEQINPSAISSYLKSKYSEKWIQKLVQEYNLKDLDLFCTQIYNKFIESTIYEFTNRISDINDINYGKPKNVKNGITLSKTDIKKICERLLVNTLNKFMLVPNVSYGSKTNQKIESIDEAEKIIQTKTSDLQIDTKLPEKKIAVIIKETPPEEIIKEKAIKDVLLDVVKNDVIIPKNDILPADEVGISPKLRTQQEIIVEPKPRGLRRIFGNRNRLGDDIRPDVFGTDGIETGIREIIE